MTVLRMNEVGAMIRKNQFLIASIHIYFPYNSQCQNFIRLQFTGAIRFGSSPQTQCKSKSQAVLHFSKTKHRTSFSQMSLTSSRQMFKSPSL